MRTIWTWLAACLLLAGPCPLARAAPPPVPTDRWLEMDLYWFDPTAIDRSVGAFWTRYAPLYRGVGGYKGVVLNVGGTADFILSFSGDLDQRIALPKGTGQELSVRIAGQLDGDDAERQRRWRERFRAHDDAAGRVGYGSWSYRDLRRLADRLRREGARRGVPGFRVAAFAVAHNNAYGEVPPFAARHPEAWTRWGASVSGIVDSSAYLDPAARLHADGAPYGGLPEGIAEGLSVADAFGAQWGAVSKRVGLDGLMLRDSFGFPRAYTRYGPYGAALPGPDHARRMTDGISALLRSLKQANPKALLMMWSTAATATADWRANGLDLERIAREGNLDIFVDQSWGGAWGEVGVRQQTFWNAPILGWTFQLATMLEHAAVLAGTRVRHYPLIETFDAWESWDTIHTAPDRLRWAIWAFSHAGVKTPGGLRMPAGSYLSWGNRGRDLLSDTDVAFLGTELGAAAADAARTVDILGPTIVYSRAAMATQVAHISPEFDVRDRTDEQVGSIIKWPLPVLSATRAEWVPRVSSDLFLFGATAGMPPDQLAAVVRLAGQGQPMAFFGAVAGATDPALSRLLDVTAAPYSPPLQDRMLRAIRGPAWPPAVRNVPSAFDAPPTATQVRAPADRVVYAFGGSAGLVLTPAGGPNLALWDPVPLFDYWYRPMRDLMGDPAPFALASATLGHQLARAGRLAPAVTDEEQTGTVAAWRLADGTVRLLAGNLEEGLRSDADRTRRVSLEVPASWRGCSWRSAWGGGTIGEHGDDVTLHLPAGGSVLASCPPSR